jgi:hypothetical protein
MAELIASGVPLGGAGLGCQEYLDFLDREYIGEYVRAGGSAVRFVVAGDDDVSARWHAGFADLARHRGYTYAAVDAADTKVSMIDHVYAAVARQVDWESLVRETVRRAWADVGLPAAGPDLTVAAVAADNAVDAREASRTMRRHLEQVILADTSLAREFRLALLRLSQAELDTGDVTDDERAAVLSWLRVEPVGLRLIRSASLYSRVARHNARALLVSLAAWLSRTTGGGLAVDLDLSRLAVRRRPPVEERSGLYYTKAGVMDAYEVLRQLVDATDVLRGAIVAVVLPPDLVTDEGRGLPAYSALQLRIVDEVRDRRRTNPYAALVRLETRLEAVR